MCTWEQHSGLCSNVQWTAHITKPVSSRPPSSMPICNPFLKHSVAASFCRTYPQRVNLPSVAQLATLHSQQSCRRSRACHQCLPTVFGRSSHTLYLLCGTPSRQVPLAWALPNAACQAAASPAGLRPKGSPCTRVLPSPHRVHHALPLPEAPCYPALGFWVIPSQKAPSPPALPLSQALG